MAGLIRAAAVDPGAFRGIHALFHRRLVPLLGGTTISLARARVAAARGKLAVGTRACSLAVRAAGRGVVVDGDVDIGAAAADALGAVDLDHWQRVVSRSQSDPACMRVEVALAATGETHRVRIADEIGDDIVVFDGANLGLTAEDRWLVVDRAGEIWRRVGRLSRQRPAAAALLLADSVRNRLGLSRRHEGDFLARLARAVLAEAEGGSL
jgi:hypothetical protein